MVLARCRRASHERPLATRLAAAGGVSPPGILLRNAAPCRERLRARAMANAVRGMIDGMYVSYKRLTSISRSCLRSCSVLSANAVGVLFVACV
mmetsp:Transcript_56308/g.125654  ORF Transcript_56308/g.125654 Transcript_56308/m.125654 type:complete len:93 (-) Transcript_56308:39-317(-)